MPGAFPSREEVHEELLAIAAKRELVAIRLPRRRRSGVLGWFARGLPEMVRVVSVRPITFQEWSELDGLLPDGRAVTKWEWRRIRAWLALRETYGGVTYAEFSIIFGDAESVLRLAPVVEAWDRVNTSFRAYIEGTVAGSAVPLGPLATRHPAVGGRAVDAGAA